MVIPYIDINPKGNGYYTLGERKFAIGTFMFGFIVLWVVLIFLGTFMRGPGWYFFWPGQYWDPHKTVALVNVDLPYVLGFRDKSMQKVVGFLATGFFLTLPLAPFFATSKARAWVKQMGAVRFGTMAMLWSLMMLLPIKMVLRWTFNIKYLWANDFFNI
jgi:hypothetical protein